MEACAITFPTPAPSFHQLAPAGCGFSLEAHRLLAGGHDARCAGDHPAAPRLAPIGMAGI